MRAPISLLLLACLTLFGCVSGSKAKRSVASENENGNLVSDLYLKLAEDSSRGVNFLGSRAPLVANFNVSQIKTLVESKSQKNNFLLLGYDNKKISTRPILENSNSIMLDEVELSHLIQGDGDFGFVSFENSPGKIKEYFSSQKEAGILIAPRRSNRDFSQPYQIAQLFAHYVHEAFHIAQGKIESSISKSRSGLDSNTDDSNQSFCAAIKTIPMKLFLAEYSQKIHDVIKAISIKAPYSVLQDKIRSVADSLRKLRSVDPKSYSFVKVSEYIEGSAEYAGMTAAIKYAGITHQDAILYQLGYNVGGIISGNDMTYKNAALAGLVADFLKINVQWNRKTYIPQLTWWEQVAATLPSQIKDYNSIIFPSQIIPQDVELNIAWMNSRYCQ